MIDELIDCIRQRNRGDFLGVIRQPEINGGRHCGASRFTPVMQGHQLGDQVRGHCGKFPPPRIAPMKNDTGRIKSLRHDS
jgi:hypothetical protein